MKSVTNIKADLLANLAVRQTYNAQTREFEFEVELHAASEHVGLL